MFLGFFVAIWRPKNVRNSDLLANGLGKIALAILGIKYKIKNQKTLLKSRPCIFISNHQSNIDAWTIATCLPSSGITLGKMAILFIPIFGQFYYLCGHFLINRKDKVGSKTKMNNLVSHLKENKLSLWIMPEGTRNKGKGILPFKKGPFHLAIGAGLPIVPVCISSYDKSFNLNKWHSGTILIEALEAIPTQGLGSEDVTPLAKKSREALIAGVKKLDDKITHGNG